MEDLNLIDSSYLTSSASLVKRSYEALFHSQFFDSGSHSTFLSSYSSSVFNLLKYSNFYPLVSLLTNPPTRQFIFQTISTYYMLYPSGSPFSYHYRKLSFLSCHHQYFLISHFIGPFSLIILLQNHVNTLPLSFWMSTFHRHITRQCKCNI